MNPYIGHDTQLYGVEEHRLVGGKGDGLRLFEVNNGKGLEITISPDRAADITRLRYKGINLSYMSPCGYVAPSYYDRAGDHWLKSFTAGFLTTCGLETVGTPSEDAGKYFPLHGSIANTPCEQAYWTQEADKLVVCGLVKDEVIFAHKLRMERKIIVSTTENVFEICDTITNTGDQEEPVMILYHMNLGYPLLDEDSVITIPSVEVVPRNAHSAKDIANWMHMQKPTPGYVEECYFHKFAGEEGVASIYQPKLDVKLSIHFNAKELDGFTQWKMMGVRDYVLGLEPGNCYPDGRKAMRDSGMLKFLKPGESKTYTVKICLE